MAKFTDYGTTEQHLNGLNTIGEKVGTEFQARVKDRTPVVTGRHQNSVELEVRPDGFVVGSTLESFVYLEAGTNERDGIGMFGTTALEIGAMLDDHMKGKL